MKIIILIPPERHFLPILIPGRLRTVRIFNKVIGPAVFIGQLLPLHLLLLPAAHNQSCRSVQSHKCRKDGCGLCASVYHKSLLVNVLLPIESGASCFSENSIVIPDNSVVLHSLHRRKFPWVPRYFIHYAIQARLMRLASSRIFMAAFLSRL